MNANTMFIIGIAVGSVSASALIGVVLLWMWNRGGLTADYVKADSAEKALKQCLSRFPLANEWRVRQLNKVYWEISALIQPPASDTVPANPAAKPLKSGE